MTAVGDVHGEHQSGTTEAEVEVEAGPGLGALSRWVLPLICSAQLLLQLDFSIVNVALPTMQAELGFTAAGLQWVVTGYALAFGSLLLLGGRIGDIVGHRRTMIIGLALFAVSSLSGGLAASPVMLVVSRIVQGGSAALVAPSALAILVGTYLSDTSRARALGIFQAATAGGATAGIVLGGVLVQFIGWRAVLLINPPVIVILIGLMLWRLPSVAPRAGNRQLDIGGAVLVTGSVAALVYAMNSGQENGFGSPITIVALALTVVLAVAFVFTEMRVKQPMLPLQIFQDRARRGSLIVIGLAGMVIVSYVYFTSLYLQSVLKLDALITGIAMIPATATVMTVSVLVSRRLLPRLGVRGMLALGLPLIAVGQLWLAQVTAHENYAAGVLPGLVLTAAGMGIAIPAAAFGANSGVTPALRGVAGGLFVMAQQVGAAVGLATLATIAAARTASSGASLLDGYRLAYLVQAGIAVIAAVLALVIIRKRTLASNASAAIPGAKE
jgi:EmrB/QacA subfamily drug resistance transporter